MLSAHPHCVDFLRLHVDGSLLAVSVFVDDAVDLAQQNLEPAKHNQQLNTSRTLNAARKSHLLSLRVFAYARQIGLANRGSSSRSGVTSSNVSFRLITFTIFDSDVLMLSCETNVHVPTM